MARCTPHRLVAAVGAGHVGCLAGAWDRRQGAVEHAEDLAEVDLGRITGEEIAAAFALSALKNSIVPEAQQNQFEELGGNLLGAGEIAIRTGSPW